MKKKYMQIPAIVLLVVAIALSLVDSIPAPIILIPLLIAVALFIKSSRGSYYFGKASKIIKEKDLARYPEAVAYLEKAIDAGMPQNYLMIAASILMQYGDMERAKNELLPITNNKDKKVRALAKITLSMYYYVNDDINEAIRLCESAKDDDGSTDRNVYVNLTVYYLTAGDRKAYRKTVKEAVPRYPSSPAIIDAQAILYMLDERWDLAGATLYAIFDTANPTFADPYVHMAMVHLHYGNFEAAITELEKAEDTLFSNISVYNAEDITRLKEAIKGEEKAKAARVICENVEKSASGTFVDWSDAEPIKAFPEEPEFKKIVIDRKDDVSDDDEDINTDLTEDDEKWLEKHSSLESNQE